MNALAYEVPLAEVEPLPLHRSSHLLRISESASTLAKVYGCGSLHRVIDGERWRFQWLCLTAPLTGVELLVRIGDTEVIVGLENLSAFGAAADIGAVVPVALHAAYLNGLGTALWSEVEDLTGRSIDVLEVRLDQPLIPDAESLGFEIGRDPGGPATRGLLRWVESDPRRDAELRRVLVAASVRQMDEVALVATLPLRWTAEVARTQLSVAELRSLEEHDVIVLEEAKVSATGMPCRLNVGVDHRYAGRVLLSKGGQLQMIQFGRTGDSTMSSDTEAGATDAASFDDIPVNLRFEVAQWSASLAEISKLAPGAVVDLDRRVDEQVVSVWVEQRCIGKGQLVAVGERLGVRLLSVYTREHA